MTNRTEESRVVSPLTNEQIIAIRKSTSSSHDYSPWADTLAFAWALFEAAAPPINAASTPFRAGGNLFAEPPSGGSDAAPEPGPWYHEWTDPIVGGTWRAGTLPQDQRSAADAATREGAEGGVMPSPVGELLSPSATAAPDHGRISAGWICAACGQRNALWADICGRCHIKYHQAEREAATLAANPVGCEPRQTDPNADGTVDRNKRGVTPASAPDASASVPDADMVICPGCAHQFRAIPVNVQRDLADARADKDRMIAELDGRMSNFRTELDGYYRRAIARAEAAEAELARAREEMRRTLRDMDAAIDERNIVATRSRLRAFLASGDKAKGAEG